MFPNIEVEVALISSLLWGVQGCSMRKGMVGGVQLGRVACCETRKEINLVYKKEKEGELEMAAKILWLVHHEDPKRNNQIASRGEWYSGRERACLMK